MISITSFAATHQYLTHHDLFNVRNEVREKETYLFINNPSHKNIEHNQERGILYAPSNRQDSTYHSLCFTSREALAGTSTAQWTSAKHWAPLSHAVSVAEWKAASNSGHDGDHQGHCLPVHCFSVILTSCVQ